LEKYGEEKLFRLGDDEKLDYAQAVVDMNRYMNILKEAFYI
jgi:hypothetical protein